MKNRWMIILALLASSLVSLAAGRVYGRIMEPHRDMHVALGDHVPLRGQFFTEYQARQREDLLREEGWTFQWSVSDGRILEGLNPGKIVFDTAGNYTLQFTVTSPAGTTFTHTRRIAVGTLSEEMAEAQESLPPDPVFLGPRHLKDLSLSPTDPQDTFVLEVLGPQETLVMQADSTQSLSMTLMPTHEEPLDGRGVSMHRLPNRVRATGLMPGLYVLQITSATPDNSATYDLRIESHAPYYVIPEVMMQESTQTRLCMSYQGPPPACAVDWIARRADGTVVDRVSQLLLPGQTRTLSVDSLFLNADQISWIQANTTEPLDLYGFWTARDGSSGYALQAISQPERNLFVPHFANPNRDWQSSFTVVQPLDRGSVQLETTYRTQEVIPGEAAWIQLTDEQLFPDESPYPGEWGALHGLAAQPSLMGIQKFSRSTSSLPEAAVVLTDPVANAEENGFHLIFPFVKVTEDGGWTDLVIVNLNPDYSAYRATFYNDMGQYEGQRTHQTIDRSELMVYTLDAFTSEFVDHPKELAWVEIESRTPIAGYALVGSDHAMTAVPSAVHLAHQLIYPLLPEGEGQRCKVAVLNPHDHPVAMHITAVDAEGAPVVSHDFVVNPKKRFWGTPKEIFNGLFPNNTACQRIACLSVLAEEPLVGFQVIEDAAGHPQIVVPVFPDLMP